VSRVRAYGCSKGSAFQWRTMGSDDAPRPTTKRPGAASQSAAMLIASVAAPRVWTGRHAQPSRSPGAQADASASGVSPSTSCASLVHRSV
jgi:hypothetical protein